MRRWKPPGGGTELRSDLDPVEADVATAGVVEFHVGPGAGVGGDGNPVRAEDAGGALDEVTLAGDAGPVDHTVLALLGDGLVGGHAQDRLGVGGVGAGNV